MNSEQLHYGSEPLTALTVSGSLGWQSETNFANRTHMYPTSGQWKWALIKINADTNGVTSKIEVYAHPLSPCILDSKTKLVKTETNNITDLYDFDKIAANLKKELTNNYNL